MDEGIEVGDRISLLAKLSPPAQPVMPGTYDYARHFYFEGIGGLVSQFPEYTWSSIGKVYSNWTKCGKMFQKVIKENTSGPSQGIVVALMTSERAAIDDQDWQQALRIWFGAHHFNFRSACGDGGCPVFYCKIFRFRFPHWFAV